MTMAPALPGAASSACAPTAAHALSEHTDARDSTRANGSPRLASIATPDHALHIHNRTQLFPTAQHPAQPDMRAASTQAPPEPAQHLSTMLGHASAASQPAVASHHTPFAPPQAWPASNIQHPNTTAAAHRTCSCTSTCATSTLRVTHRMLRRCPASDAALHDVAPWSLPLATPSLLTDNAEFTAAGSRSDGDGGGCVPAAAAATAVAAAVLLAQFAVCVVLCRTVTIRSDRP